MAKVVFLREVGCNPRKKEKEFVLFYFYWGFKFILRIAFEISSKYSF